MSPQLVCLLILTTENASPSLGAGGKGMVKPSEVLGGSHLRVFHLDVPLLTRPQQFQFASKSWHREESKCSAKADGTALALKRERDSISGTTFLICSLPLSKATANIAMS